MWFSRNRWGFMPILGASAVLHWLALSYFGGMALRPSGPGTADLAIGHVDLRVVLRPAVLVKPVSPPPSLIEPALAMAPQHRPANVLSHPQPPKRLKVSSLPVFEVEPAFISLGDGLVAASSLTTPLALQDTPLPPEGTQIAGDVLIVTAAGRPPLGLFQENGSASLPRYVYPFDVEGLGRYLQTRFVGVKHASVAFSLDETGTIQAFRLILLGANGMQRISASDLDATTVMMIKAHPITPARLNGVNVAGVMRMEFDY